VCGSCERGAGARRPGYIASLLHFPDCTGFLLYSIVETYPV